MDDAEKEVRKKLKKHLGEGLIVPAGVGTIVVTTMDLQEYGQSKADGGFIHQTPIVLHVRAGGAGQYEDYINKFMTTEDADELITALQVAVLTLRIASGEL